MQNKTGCALFLFFFLIFSPVVCRANPAYIDDTKGHCVVIEDDADLLTEEEEKVLSFTMSDCAQYGNVLFLTVADNTFSSGGSSGGGGGFSGGGGGGASGGGHSF